MMPPIDWHTALVPTVNLGELFLRGSVLYLFLFFAFRILRRQGGAIGMSDLLAVVLIADAAQNAMASEYRSVPEGLVLVSTILFWDWALDWLAFRFPTVRPLVQAGAVPLIVRGRYQRENMDRQLITEDDLKSQLRQHGVAGARGVVLCNLEGDGHISVLQSEEEDHQADAPRSRGAS
jgi:uncharacterized membrane protein YcaP (DUF421 family)